METNYRQRRAHAQSRRRFLAAAAASAAGVAGLALAGCGDDSDGSAASSTPAGTAAPGATPAAEKPLRGGTMRLPLAAPANSINPSSLYPFESATYTTQIVAAFHYSRLLRAVARADIAPEDKTVLEGDLASGFEQVDPLTYRFTLKPNAKWQNKAPLNGRAITATDYVKSYEAFFARTKLDPRWATQFVAVVDRVEAPDERTVKFTLKTPYAPFLATMAAANDGPWLVPVETVASEQARRDPVGSGPFIFRELAPDVSIIWDRNPDYYDTPANFDRVQAILTPSGGDVPRIVAGLRSGELDASGLGGSVFREVRPTLVHHHYDVAGDEAGVQAPRDEVLARRAAGEGPAEPQWSCTSPAGTGRFPPVRGGGRAAL